LQSHESIHFRHFAGQIGLAVQQTEQSLPGHLIPEAKRRLLLAIRASVDVDDERLFVVRLQPGWIGEKSFHGEH